MPNKFFVIFDSPKVSENASRKLTKFFNLNILNKTHNTDNKLFISFNFNQLKKHNAALKFIVYKLKSSACTLNNNKLFGLKTKNCSHDHTH